MERFVKGDIVVIPFPFSDLTSIKNRPALIVANIKGEDIILSEITSKQRNNEYSVPINNKEIIDGKLNFDSIIRINRLFTAEKSLILYKLGALKPKKIKKVEEMLISMFKA